MSPAGGARAEGAAKRPAPWWARPSVVLPTVAALAVLAALFSPARQTLGGDPRLSTLSTAPLGAALTHDLLARLGWRVERQMRAGMPDDPAAVHVVLAPAIPLRLTEVRALLAHVRAGGAAFVVGGRATSSLLDSLRLRPAGAGRIAERGRPEDACPKGPLDVTVPGLWFQPTMRLLSLEWAGPAPGRTEEFMAAVLPGPKASEVRRPALLGIELGAGRIVVAVDADLLRNDALRNCELGFDVAVVRAFEFLRAGGPVARDRVVFDEYHQGHGAHPGTVRAAALYLRDAPSGRFLLQLAVAGLVLLVALAPRNVPPRTEGRVERRSPLEQVDALARAYAQVGATRTAAARLVRGLRRRLERGLRGGGPVRSDAVWLADLASRHPELADDVSLLSGALDAPVPPRTFALLGPALHRLEATLTRR